jgi:hypothetical protein
VRQSAHRSLTLTEPEMTASAPSTRPGFVVHILPSLKSAGPPSLAQSCSKPNSSFQGRLNPDWRTVSSGLLAVIFARHRWKLERSDLHRRRSHIFRAICTSLHGCTAGLRHAQLLAMLRSSQARQWVYRTGRGPAPEASGPDLGGRSVFGWERDQAPANIGNIDGR